MKKTGLITSLILLLGIGAAFGQGSADYIRYQRGRTDNDGALQIAVETWRTPNGTLIDLYGVVHIADAAYYQQVQRELDAYDAVLYEGVGATREALAERRRNPQSASGLSTVQKLFGTVLGLQFQMDGIAYTSSNLVHADMGAETFRRETKGQNINPLEEYVSPEQLQRLGPIIELGGVLIQKYFEANPETRNSLKTQFASQIAGADMTQQLPPQLYQTIVIDRNAIVMRVLAGHLQANPRHRRIAIFYGAAHMPDFNQRFVQLGYTKVSTRWMTAWSIGQGAPEQRKATSAPKIEKREPAEVR